MFLLNIIAGSLCTMSVIVHFFMPPEVQEASQWSLFFNTVFAGANFMWAAHMQGWI